MKKRSRNVIFKHLYENGPTWRQDLHELMAEVHKERRREEAVKHLSYWVGRLQNLTPEEQNSAFAGQLITKTRRDYYVEMIKEASNHLEKGNTREYGDVSLRYHDDKGRIAKIVVNGKMCYKLTPVGELYARKKALI